MSLDVPPYSNQTGGEPVTDYFSLENIIPDRFAFTGERKGACPAEIAGRLANQIDWASRFLEMNTYYSASPKDQKATYTRAQSYIFNSLIASDNQVFIDAFSPSDLLKVFNVCHNTNLLKLPVIYRIMSGLRLNILSKAEAGSQEVASFIRKVLQEIGYVDENSNTNVRSRKIRNRRKGIRVPSIFEARKSKKLASSLQSAASILRSPEFISESPNEQLRVKRELKSFFIGVFQSDSNLSLVPNCEPMQALKIYRACLDVGLSEHPLICEVMDDLFQVVVDKRRTAKPGVVLEMMNLAINRRLENGFHDLKSLVPDRFIETARKELPSLDPKSRLSLLGTMKILGKSSKDLARQALSLSLTEMKHREADFGQFKKLIEVVFQHNLTPKAIYDQIIKELKLAAADFHPESFKKLVKFIANSGRPVPHRIFENYIPRLQRINTAASAVSLIRLAASETYAADEFIKPLITTTETDLSSLKAQDLGSLVRALGNINCLDLSFAAKITAHAIARQSLTRKHEKDIKAFVSILLGLEYSALHNEKENNAFYTKSFRKLSDKIWEYIASDIAGLKCGSTDTGITLAQLAKISNREIPSQFQAAAEKGLQSLHQDPSPCSELEESVVDTLESLQSKGEISELKINYRDAQETLGLEYDFVFNYKGIKIFIAVDSVPHHYINRSLESGRKGRDLLIEKIAQQEGFICMPINDVEWYGVNGSRYKYIAKKLKEIRDEILGRHSKHSANSAAIAS
ncbi:MAG: hypothetical protein R3A13_08995 [Bdellovibrionota bacterium]